MLPKQHFIYGISLSLVAMPLIGIINSFLIFFGAFFIDFDHYIRHLFVYQDISLKKAIKYCSDRTKMPYHIVHIFHTAEFLVLLLLLSYIWEFFLYILLGVLFHHVLDFIEMVDRKWYEVRIYSLFLWLLVKI